jgi:hypothetical protein
MMRFLVQKNNKASLAIEKPANKSLTKADILRGSSKFPRVTELTASLDFERF